MEPMVQLTVRVKYESYNAIKQLAEETGESLAATVVACLERGLEGHQTIKQHYHQQRSRILSTDAWKIWKGGGRDIPLAASKHVFRIDSYIKGDFRKTKISRLRSLFDHDDDVRPFLDHLICDLNKETSTPPHG